MKRIELIKQLSKKVQNKNNLVLSKNELDRIIKSDYCVTRSINDFKVLNFN